MASISKIDTLVTVRSFVRSKSLPVVRSKSLPEPRSSAPWVKRRRSHLLVDSGCRLAFSHLFAFTLAWQLGFYYQCLVRCSLLHEASMPGFVSYEEPRFRRQRNGPAPNRFIPSTVSKLVVGIATLNYDDFVSSFALGAPLQGISNPDDLDPPYGGSRVLLLQQNPSSVNHTAGADFRSIMQACQQVKHVVVHLGRRNERNRGTCLALVGQTESYHMNKWIVDEQNAADVALGGPNLVRANNYLFLKEYDQLSGLLSFVPYAYDTQTSNEVVRAFMAEVDDAMAILQPLSDRVASSGDASLRDTVVVMVSNVGHAELVMNFVCASRSNGIDLSKVLFFATDLEMHKIATSLGLASFFHERIFQFIPERAAEIYGDSSYARIMLSKSFATYLASRTGYDFIFQDADIVPYRSDYWSWWTGLKESNYDLYFQQDFNGRAEYSPWIANSGCYFVRNNARTRYLFSSFVWQGDMILTASSHQAAFHVALSELASQSGLRVKTLQAEHGLLPNGWHFHRNFAYMRKMISDNKTKPLSFHMNWNDDKVQKVKLLEQMGDWHVGEQCLNGRTADEMTSLVNSTSIRSSAMKNAVHLCCLAGPLVRCHFRDKPSDLACRNHTFETKGDWPEFW